jgi:endoglucanase
MLDRRSVLGLGSCALACAALGGPAAAAKVAAPKLAFPGVNLAGGEFGTGSRLNWDYIYPSEKQVAYYASRGFRLLRVPVKSSRLIVNGRPNPVDIKILQTVVAAARARSMIVVLDLHEYAIRPDGQPMTDADRAAFRLTWRIIAGQFSRFSNVWFGLMNEPNKQTPEQWFRLANAGIAGVRDSAPQHMITVMGSQWGTADGWVRSGNAAACSMLRDPANKLVIEMHQYLDNAGGNAIAAAVSGLGATSLTEATLWARANHRRLYLGEFGVTASPAFLDEGRALLRYMNANSDVWLAYSYWAGGLWWAQGRSNYAYSLEPANLDAPVDRPQMKMLRQFM